MVSIDLNRFTQICGMMGSDHSGERAAAAAAATKMLRSAGMTWEELLSGLAPKANEKANAVNGRTTQDGGWRSIDALRELKKHYDDLTPWQQKFVDGVAEFGARYGAGLRLSEKQWAQVHKMLDQVGAGQ